MNLVKSTAWQTLANYESQDLVRRRHQQRFGRELNAAAAREIRSSTTQAREYFESANTADRVVRPLLIYYGVLSLSRALTMFLTGNREATLSQAHGLQAVHWGQTLSEAVPPIENLKVRLTGGSFLELVQATENVSLLTANSSMANFELQHPLPTAGQEVSLLELLSRIPEIGAQLVRWQTKPNFLPLSIHRSNGNRFQARVNRRIHGVDLTDAEIREFFPAGESLTLLSPPDQNQLHYEGAESTAIPILWDSRRSFFRTVGDLVAIKPFSRVAGLSKLAGVFVLSYILGMLVRYHPSVWMSLVSNELGDASLPTILAAMEYLETEFPQLALEHLERDLL